jgi:antirestriction protein ArdC
MTKTRTRRAASAIRPDVYARVTDRIIAALEAGTRPWAQPWTAEGGAFNARPLRANGLAYRGVNVVLLWMTAQEAGYRSRFWLTYRQAQALGAQVRKGEKSALVVYANAIERIETTDAGEEETRRIPFMKGYAVFNADQIDGLPDHYQTPAEPKPDRPAFERIAHADAFFAETGADIREGGSRAYYSPAQDFIQMPPFASFRDAESHATTLAHELVHWTKGPGRLERDFGRKSWGDEGYAREELVAELGASFLAADLKLEIEPREDHAAYVASWLKVLRDDKRAIFSAASHAEKAVGFLHGLQPGAGAASEGDAAPHPNPSEPDELRAA